MNTETRPVELIYFPHPTLRFNSRPITRVDDRLQTLVAAMFDIMYEQRGVGLAANQVNVPLRVFVANESGIRGEGEELVFINPVLSRQKGGDESEEGCLSIPGVRAMVKRSKSLHISAYDLSGREVELDCSGFLARIVQHETDHLNGTLFIDRLDAAIRRSLEEEIEALEIDYESKKRLQANSEDDASLQDWLTRYA